ncbi:hypothetical protein MesoLj113b_19850 [Mesorhizobium sp. 113-3-3]|nr:hypothetical protein MesoLj113b_19850 [Mesorhizobium sp. 113-3-3]
MTNPDIVIIGSGIGGATIASGLAGSGASILMLERGEPLPATPHARDTRRWQFQILRRGADPLPQGRFLRDGALWRRLAGLAVFL